MNIALDQLHPRTGQPRQHFGAEALAELTANVKVNGVLSPLLVRPVEGGFEVIGGHRRLRAAQAAGLAQVPCEVRELDDRTARELVLLDNEHRVDFEPWEAGAAYQDLLSNGYTLAQVCDLVSHLPPYVKDRLRLAENLSEPARQAYLDKELTLEALNYLAKLPNEVVCVNQCEKPCERTYPPDEAKCPSCGRPAPMFPLGGNPQLAALPEMRGKQNGQVEQIFARFQQVYCLGRQIRQDSMSLEDQAAELKTVEARDLLDKYLEAISRAGSHAIEHAPRLAKMTPARKEAVRAKITSARAYLDAIEREVA